MSKWKDIKDVGECNFCRLNDYRKVMEFGCLRGEWHHGGQVVVRICRKCLEALNRLAG